MKSYYPDAQEEIDPEYPEPLGKPVEVTIFVDASHADNQLDRIYITGLCVMLGTTPYHWFSKRQTCLETSTFGSEFAAMRVAVEEAIAARQTLLSIGVPVSGPVRLIGDNSGVVDNSSLPGSPLSKKHISIQYHKVCECIAAGVCKILHVNEETDLKTH